MAIVFYSMAAIVSAFLFLPRSEGEPFRNIPLLLSIVSLFLLLYIVRFFQYIILMNKTKKHFISHGYKTIGQKIIPAFLFYKGNYALEMQKGNDKIYLRFLVRKNSYLHYHFEEPDKVEFYKYTRGFFYGGKMKVVAPISKTAEKSKTGSRKLYLPKLKNEKTVIIFNRMPDYVSDSVKKEGLGNGDYICNTEIQLYEVEHLTESNISFDAK